ncbi:MAG: TetR/AcrR family transcriptional regulator [Treponema sp.]|nr:TetR/AcrR family transcriptional regulator [Treponema sp.]
MNDSSNPSAVRSKKEITQALLTLMRQYPYSQISVKQIIMEAKLARKTFYRNFESKDDVLLSLLRGILREYYAAVYNNMSDLLTVIFTFVNKNKKLLLLLDKNDMLYIPLQCINEYLPELHKKFFLETNPHYYLFENLDADYIMSFNIGAVWNMISLWIRRGMKDSPESVKANIKEYISRIRKKPL